MPARCIVRWNSTLLQSDAGAVRDLVLMYALGDIPDRMGLWVLRHDALEAMMAYVIRRAGRPRRAAPAADGCRAWVFFTGRARLLCPTRSDQVIREDPAGRRRGK